ncbi:GGDEF domain-containing protein [Acidovorax sp. FJL06]|nr:GGDEF domain-containing protein [Acidovorax sp. FJL06]
MPSLDLRSLTIMAGLIGIVMGLVLLGLRRNYPASIRGMRLWGAAPLVCAGSTLFYGLDGVLPASLVALIGNALLLLGVTLFLLGSEQLHGLPPSWRRWAMVIVATLLLLTLFMLVYPDYRIRVLIFSGTLAAIVVEHARLLGRHGKGFAHRFTAMALWGQAAVLVCRAASTLWLDQADTQRFAQSTVQTVYIATFSFSVLLISIGVLLMAGERVRAEFEYLATHDSLTGAHTRRAVLAACADELARWSRYGSPFSLLILDIDHFKRINDAHGHLAGDQVLAHFVQIIQAHLRSADRLGRYGGEEFMVLLPETDIEAATHVAERMRASLDATPDSAGRPHCTVSIGLTTVQPGDGKVDTLIARADAALYEAKAQGRNRVQAG